MNTWRLFDRYPPILVRLLARHRYGRPLSLEEIADRSGLSPIQVIAISMQCDWTGVDPYQIRAFIKGCNADIIGDNKTRERIAKYCKRPTWKFLRTSPEWKTVYEPMLRRYIQHATAMAKPTNRNQQ